jgi:O-acetyl-ADP-ribose deacetylase (regulator of RNase III)
MGEHLNFITGDLIALAKEGRFDVIAHGCNCFCTMGAGVALAIATAWPEAKKADDATVPGELSKLGTTTRCAVVLPNGRPMDIVNCYTQFRFDRGSRQFDYGALEQCMDTLGFVYYGLRLGLPKIGAGLAGGDWDLIRPILIDKLDHLCDVTVVELPGGNT